MRRKLALYRLSLLLAVPCGVGFGSAIDYPGDPPNAFTQLAVLSVALAPAGVALPGPPTRSRAGSFQIDFDFVDHRLPVRTSDGEVRSLALRPRSVADFHRELMATLRGLGIEVAIHPRPNELEDATPFAEDEGHASYDPDAANRFWRALVQADRVFTAFRARFLGKCSPVHFFWGAFDLAVTRFSGRPAPRHPGGVPHLPDWVVREAYSHEVCSAGFWPGGGGVA